MTTFDPAKDPSRHQDHPKRERRATGHEGGHDAGHDHDPPSWTIAEMAEEFDLTHRALRHYEAIGLLQPVRVGTRRIYHRRDRTRLGLIQRGKRLGFPLEQIRLIIDLYDAPRGKRSQLEYVLGQIDDRRADLEHRRADLEAALVELDQFESRCRQELAGLD